MNANLDMGRCSAAEETREDAASNAILKMKYVS